jgi:hypothetical protein
MAAEAAAGFFYFVEGSGKLQRFPREHDLVSRIFRIGPQPVNETG